MQKRLRCDHSGPGPIRLGLLLAAPLVIALGSAHAQEAGTDSRRPLRELNSALQELSEQVAPAVVQVFTTGLTVVSDRQNQGAGMVAPTRTSGSGLLVDPEGYIITNAHIVAGAQRIGVLRILPNEGARVEGSLVRPIGRLLEAKLLGYDLETDLAVLKIETKVLRFLRFGDSDRLRKGQLVFAFGNSQGSEDSVSMGVVSSVARQLTPEDPVVYVQTDASIKPGNDGGPLVDIDGRIVGINNFQVSESAARTGFGFAVPGNIMQAVYRQIRQTGRVQRGVIGALTQTITPQMAGPLSLPRDRGVIVADVLPVSPADLAGLRTGDIILSLNGKAMENARQFDVNIYQQKPGETVSLEVLRGDSQLTVAVQVVERGDDPSRFAKLVDPQRNFIPQLGVLALDVDDEVDDMLSLLRIHEGVLVAGLALGVPPVYEFQPGDVIHSINGNLIESLDELRAELNERKKGDIIVLQVERQGQIRFATLAIE